MMLFPKALFCCARGVLGWLPDSKSTDKSWVGVVDWAGWNERQVLGRELGSRRRELEGVGKGCRGFGGCWSIGHGRGG